MSHAQTEHPQVTATRIKLLGIRGHWPEVGKAAGVSYSWLQKFARGDITNPTIDTLQAVSDGCDTVAAVIAQLPSRQQSTAAAVG